MLDLGELFVRISAKGADETTKKLSGLSSAVKTTFKGISTAAAGAAAASATAVGALVTQSTKAYADFEQLAGGVETLFGAGGKSLEEYAKTVGKSVEAASGEYNKLMASQQAVFDNANIAYKTAGMSANEYMETVTSFSASLLQSLGGDTQKAASVADKAIIDMSDNANKMGTSMDMIQNAYQGFAKQNYTMLDNLKLGYGGTKEEMQRLLTDAGKLANTKFDISSYADVIEAIHVVQENMGITGTTATEAATTIQGSTASMKAAWNNMLVSLTTGGANFDMYINNLVDSVASFGNNIVPVITSALSGVSKMIDGLAPIIAQQVPTIIAAVLPGLTSAVTTLVNSLSNVLPGLVSSLSPSLINGIIEVFNGLVSCLPQLISVGLELITGLLQGITQALPSLVEIGMQAITSLITGLTSALPELIPVAIDAIMQLVDSLLDNIDMLVDVSVEMIMVLADGLTSALPTLIAKASEIIGRLLTAIANNLPKLQETGIKLIIQLGIGLIQAIPQLIAAIAQIISAIFQAFASYASKMAEIGLNLVKGIWQGISQNAKWLLGKIKEWCGSILEGIKKFFGINSPAKTTEEFGVYLSQGLAVGIEKDDSPEEALKKKGENLLNILKDFKDDFSLTSDTAKSTYDLWAAQNPNADNGQKLAKEYEMLTIQAKAQADIIEVTNKAYWKQAELTGQNSVEARELANTLLQEQTVLEKLNKSIEDNVIERQKLSNTAKATAEAYIENIDYSYELWQAMNSQATEAEKQAKENEFLTEKIKAQGDYLHALNDELLVNNKLYGENSEQSKETIKNIKDETLAYYKLKAQIDEAAASAEKLRKSQLLDSLNAQLSYNNLLKQKDSTHVTALGRQQAAWNESGMYKTGALIINQTFNTNTVTANQLYNNTKKAINDMEGAGAL